MGACGVRLMRTASVAVSAESGHTPLPNDATSILEHWVLSMGVCLCVCVCPQANYPGGDNKAPYTGSDHSLFGAARTCVFLCVCAHVCVCPCMRE